MTLVTGSHTADREPDPALIKAVVWGHARFDDLVTGRAESVNEIAAGEGLTPRYVARLLDLAFLPPTLVEAILEGRQPADMTAEQLSRSGQGSIIALASWTSPSLRQAMVAQADDHNTTGHCRCSQAAGRCCLATWTVRSQSPCSLLPPNLTPRCV